MKLLTCLALITCVHVFSSIFSNLAIIFYELCHIFRIIEFCTTDPHKGYFTHIKVIYD